VPFYKKIQSSSKLTFKCLLITSILHLGFAHSAFAVNYLQYFKIDTLLVYKHWNTKRKKITGYTRIKYQKIKEGSTEIILETQENTEDDGEVFSQRKVWFDANTGETLRYSEEDLRVNTLIENTYDGKSITTLLKKKDFNKELREIRSSELVTWELLWFYMQEQVKEHDYNNKKITIYFPHALFETDLIGTKLEILVKKEKTLNINTPVGNQSAIQLFAQPTSWLLSNFPQLNFRFTISTKKPYYILKFEQADTQYILDTIETIRQ